MKDKDFKAVAFGALLTLGVLGYGRIKKWAGYMKYLREYDPKDMSQFENQRRT